MSTVTGKAVSLLVRTVGIFVFSGQFLVTRQAVVCQVSLYQGVGLRGMRIMACQAGTLSYGLMGYALSKGCGFLVMAFVTELCAGLLQQSFKSSDMRIMTQSALILGDRSVHIPFGEIRLLVTLKAGCLCEGMPGKGYYANQNQHKLTSQ